MRPPIPSITLSRRAKIALWTAGALIALLIVLLQLTGVYINWLWFGSVGHRGVYRTIFWTRLILFVVFGTVMSVIICGNIVVAYLLSPPFRPMSAEQQNIERYRAMVEPRRILVLLAVGAIAFLGAGLSAQNNWASWQLWLHGSSFGITDPQFHKDIAFYAWDYPVYRLVLSVGFTAIIFAIILSSVVHYLSGAIRLQTPGPKITVAARRQLTLLAFVFMLLKAIAYWLDRYGLVFSERTPQFTGASYTDVHAVLPARTILFWIALIIAAGLLGSLWLRSTLLPGIAFVSMLVLSILISGIYPALQQQISVKPNAANKEAPYIQRNITATREAYNIVSGTNVKYVPYKAETSPSNTAVAAKGNATLDNVRILDPNIISPTVSKFQQLGGNVYGFAPKLDVDRYTLNGSTHDYIVGVRELDAANLNGNQTNWINQHTNYTHGYGLVAAEANTDITLIGNQRGAFAAGGIPATGVLKPTHPDVYYGELMPDYSIVGVKGTTLEYDGDGRPKVTYAGGGGVSLSSLVTRLAFAANYKQSNFLLSSAVSGTGARIIFNRDPRTLVQKVAPFLKVDGDPYPIIDSQSGDIVWMLDGYTTINNFPYSERQSLSSLTHDSLAATNKTAQQPDDSINYIRNSVKATVDAYTGKVTLYQWDANDAVLKSWMQIFPGLVQPKTSMPVSISSHVRYPEDLFQVQRAMLAQYHVDDPVTFYNVGDKWTVPSDPTSSSNGSQPPFYVLAAPATNISAADDKSVFQLTSPMNVNQSTYLASYLSVNGDAGPDYGTITALTLPKGTQAVQAPEQVYNKITSNSVITKDLTFFNAPGGGSTVLHGNLLTLPLGDSFMYVEPLYNRSSVGGRGTYPTLVRVIVVYGDQVGYGKNLETALSDFASNPANTGGTLPGGTNTVTTPPASTGSGSPAPSPSTSSGGTTGTGPVSITQIDSAIAALKAAYATGDPVQVGQAEAALQKLIGRYNAAPSTPSTPTPSGSKGSSPRSAASSPPGSPASSVASSP